MVPYKHCDCVKKFASKASLSSETTIFVSSSRNKSPEQYEDSPSSVTKSGNRQARYRLCFSKKVHDLRHCSPMKKFPKSETIVGSSSVYRMDFA
jgi:hypothetical protein